MGGKMGWRPWRQYTAKFTGPIFHHLVPPFQAGAFDSAKNHKRQRRKRQSVTANRKKSQTPKFV